MEFMCPACGKWTEIAERQAISGNRCRCAEYWTVLLIESHRPFRVRVEPSTGKPLAHVGSGTPQGGEEHD